MSCAFLAGTALLGCLARDPACLPPAQAHFLPLIVSTIRQESGSNPYAVRNEREGRGHFFTTREAAIAYAVEADARGDTLGLGWGQITHRANWRLHTGMEGRGAIEALLDPCMNLRATAVHYAAAYGASVAYNAGAGRLPNPPAASAAYARRVLAGADGAPRTTPSPSPAAQPAAEPAPPPCAPAWDGLALARCSSPPLPRRPRVLAADAGTPSRSEAE